MEKWTLNQIRRWELSILNFGAENHLPSLYTTATDLLIVKQGIFPVMVRTLFQRIIIAYLMALLATLNWFSQNGSI